MINSNNTRVRSVLIESIEKFPGIRYRELLRLTNLADGVMSYHIGLLDKKELIKIAKKGRVTRFYPTAMNEYDTIVIGALRVKTARQIVLFVLSNEGVSFNDIVSHAKRAPSTVSWNLKKLRSLGLIQQVQKNGHMQYTVNVKDDIIRLLSKYKSSFLDRMVDNFVDVWCEL
ncbi:MAG: winged helix-turn-helix transcriptional regulator [Nitrososphaerales archaeon]